MYVYCVDNKELTFCTKHTLRVSLSTSPNVHLQSTLIYKNKWLSLVVCHVLMIFKLTVIKNNL